MSQVVQQDCTMVFNYTCVTSFLISYITLDSFVYCVAMDHVSELNLYWLIDNIYF